MDDEKDNKDFYPSDESIECSDEFLILDEEHILDTKVKENPFIPKTRADLKELDIQFVPKRFVAKVKEETEKLLSIIPTCEIAVSNHQDSTYIPRMLSIVSNNSIIKRLTKALKNGGSSKHYEYNQLVLEIKEIEETLNKEAPNLKHKLREIERKKEKYCKEDERIKSQEEVVKKQEKKFIEMRNNKDIQVEKITSYELNLEKNRTSYKTNFDNLEKKKQNLAEKETKYLEKKIEHEKLEQRLTLLIEKKQRFEESKKKKKYKQSETIKNKRKSRPKKVSFWGSIENSLSIKNISTIIFTILIFSIFSILVRPKNNNKLSKVIQENTQIQEKKWGYIETSMKNMSQRQGKMAKRIIESSEKMTLSSKEMKEHLKSTNEIVIGMREDLSKVKQTSDELSASVSNISDKINDHDNQLNKLNKTNFNILHDINKNAKIIQPFNRFKIIYGPTDTIFRIDELVYIKHSKQKRTISLKFSWVIHKNYKKNYEKNCKKARYTIYLSVPGKSKSVKDSTLIKKDLDKKEKTVKITIPKYWDRNIEGPYKITLNVRIGIYCQTISIDTPKF